MTFPGCRLDKVSACNQCYRMSPFRLIRFGDKRKIGRIFPICAPHKNVHHTSHHQFRVLFLLIYLYRYVVRCMHTHTHTNAHQLSNDCSPSASHCQVSSNMIWHTTTTTTRNLSYLFIFMLYVDYISYNMMLGIGI